MKYIRRYKKKVYRDGKKVTGKYIENKNMQYNFKIVFLLERTNVFFHLSPRLKNK